MSEAAAGRAMFNADGSFVEAAALRRAKGLNIVAGSLGSLWFALCLGSYFILFARSLGASDVVIGLLATIPSLAAIVQIASAYVVERLGHRKPFWAVVEYTRRIVLGAMLFLPFVFPEDHQRAVVVLLVLLAVSSTLGTAAFSPWYSWMADIIPQHERGRFFGVRSAIINIVIIIFFPLFGRVLDSYTGSTQWTGFAIVFGAGTLLGLADLTTHCFIPEPPMKKESEGPDLAAMIRRPLKDANFRRFFLGWGIWSFATLITTPFYAVYYRENLLIDYSVIGLLTSVALAAAVVGSWFWGIVADKLGSKPVFNLCLTTSIPIPIMYFFASPENARILLTIQAFYAGFVASGTNVGFTNLLMGLSPREGRGMFVAVFFSTTGVIGAVAPIVGGYIARNFPIFFFSGFGGFFSTLTKYHNLMLISMVLYLFCIPFFLRIREVGSAPMGVVLGNILLVSPIRTFAQLTALKAGLSVRSRAKAVRSLAAMRTRLATDDLLARLDDPSVVIREETIDALGEIGDPSAVPALLERLKNPVAHSTLTLVRALGLIRDERALAPLMAHLEDTDRHVRGAAARALGEMGSPKAIPALKALIRRETKPQVIANAVEALGELGSAADMWEVLPYLSVVENPILKRQMAFAVGNLLGRRYEFYRIISAETRRRGREVKKLTAQLLKHLGKDRESEELRQHLRNCGAAYLAGEARQCISVLSDIGYVIARDVYGFEGPREMLMEVAVLRDARFAAGLWFLHMLRTGEIEPTIDDVLLGLYFLASAEYKDVPRLS